ncbi:hypothetical protein EDB80DRAFT_383127 [Ilyonectria destructans]|nr:hypothetical protein EDB80DRAFT_383127 [Ilyonectria destructans]
MQPALEILTWVCFAREPLSIKELHGAVSVKIGGSGLSTDVKQWERPRRVQDVHQRRARELAAGGTARGRQRRRGPEPRVYGIRGRAAGRRLGAADLRCRVPHHHHGRELPGKAGRAAELASIRVPVGAADSDAAVRARGLVPGGNARAGATTRTIRDRTTKANCQYQVDQVASRRGAVEERTVDMVRRLGSEAMADEIGCDFHHSGMSEEDRRRVRTAWVEGQGHSHRWIVATTLPGSWQWCTWSSRTGSWTLCSRPGEVGVEQARWSSPSSCTMGGRRGQTGTAAS